MNPKRYAAIDIGTNSCRLLLAELRSREIFPLMNKIETTRIGEGINAEGRITPPAIQRNIECLIRFSHIIKEHEINCFRAVATCAVREASNRREFLARAEQEVGFKVEVISAEEEANLSYLGVVNGLSLESAPLVADLGGGSTELMLKEKDGDHFFLSLAIGAVRATEGEMTAADIARTLTPLSPYKKRLAPHPLVFVGGTATTLAAVKQSLEVYNPELVHGHVLSRREIGDMYNLLERMPLSLRKRLPGLQPERADIIPRGTLITLLLMDLLEKPEIIVSESDILQGIIWELANQNNINEAKRCPPLL